MEHHKTSQIYTRARDDYRRRRTAAVGMGNGHMPAQRVFPSAQSTSNPPSAPDEALHAHLCARAGRLKSENRQRASTLRRPRPPAGPASGTLGRLRGRCRRRSHRAPGAGNHHRHLHPHAPTRRSPPMPTLGHAGPRSTSPDI
ncbi:hypothetical protein FIBSPDRAFT_877966, partial [Athelia psychrophila]